MTTGKIFVGDSPTFRDVIKDQDGNIVDIGTATLNMIFRKPGNIAVMQDAVLTGDGSDGKMEYTATAADLDVEGVWQRQSKVVIGSETWRSVIKKFTVYAVLPEPET